MTMVIAVAALLISGVLLGIELAVLLLHGALDGIDDDATRQARISSARRFGRLMPPAYALTVMLAVLTAVLTWGGPGAVSASIAGVLLTAAIVLSVRVLVPINREILRWEEHGAPSTWRHPLRRWDRLHAVRVLLLAAAAFSLGLTALLL